MKSQVLQALGKTPNKKTLKFHLELNFNNFLTVGIDIIGSCINIISELAFSIGGA